MQQKSKKLYPSDKIYIRKSNIKDPGNPGRGVFAARNIKKGELIEKCPIIDIPTGDMSNLSESILATYFFYYGRKKERLAVALGFGSIYNHSYEPNATYKISEKEKTIDFISIKDINKDEEITFNYSSGNPRSSAPLWFEVANRRQKG